MSKRNGFEPGGGAKNGKQDVQHNVRKGFPNLPTSKAATARQLQIHCPTNVTGQLRWSWEGKAHREEKLRAEETKQNPTTPPATGERAPWVALGCVRLFVVLNRVYFNGRGVPHSEKQSRSGKTALQKNLLLGPLGVFLDKMLLHLRPTHVSSLQGAVR